MTDARVERTPEEWLLDPISGIITTPHDPSPVAVVFLGGDGDARANLVVAAPDVTNALEALLARVECGTALDCATCDAARAALAKARGAMI